MGYLGIPQNRDDGKRALAAIEVAGQSASSKAESGQFGFSGDS